jgi:hypothetical protein
MIGKVTWVWIVMVGAFGSLIVLGQRQPVVPPGPLPLLVEQPQSPSPIDGSLAQGVCADFRLNLGVGSVDLPEIVSDGGDPGWIWVQKAVPSASRMRSVVGLVEKSQVTSTDFPALHDSHDLNVIVKVDPAYRDLLSDANEPNEAGNPAVVPPTDLEAEWEIGTFPKERAKNSPERFIPKWAWPSVGDRVWMNGNWIFDCGHPKVISGKKHYRSEIHPPRAIAGMRRTVRRMPGANNAFVPVTATNLYIHGRGGYVTDTLYCGAKLIVSANPDSCPTKTSPIAERFEFDIQAPPRPSQAAALITQVVSGPGNTVTIAPILEPHPETGSVHVIVPLANSGVQPTAVYARRIYVGWNVPARQNVLHFQLTLNKMDLHEDQDLDPGDCECTFFWMNVDKAENAWIRLSDFAQGNMNDYDDDGGFGNGEIKFSGATFDFYVLDGERYTVRANGYDQDCFDDLFGNHKFTTGSFANCYLGKGLFKGEPGDNDAYAGLERRFGAPSYGSGNQDVTAQNQYELEFSVKLLETIPPPPDPTKTKVGERARLKINFITIVDDCDGFGAGDGDMYGNLRVDGQVLWSVPESQNIKRGDGERIEINRFVDRNFLNASGGGFQITGFVTDSDSGLTGGDDKVGVWDLRENFPLSYGTRDVRSKPDCESRLNYTVEKVNDILQ